MSRASGRMASKRHGSLPVFREEDLVDARDWIKDCIWQDLETEDVDNLSPLVVVRGVERHYDGGWEQFLIDTHPPM